MTSNNIKYGINVKIFKNNQKIVDVVGTYIDLGEVIVVTSFNQNGIWLCTTNKNKLLDFSIEKAGKQPNAGMYICDSSSTIKLTALYDCKYRVTSYGNLYRYEVAGSTSTIKGWNINGMNQLDLNIKKGDTITCVNANGDSYRSYILLMQKLI